MRINAGAVAPVEPFNVLLHVSDNFIQSMPGDAEIKVFAQIFQDGGMEVLDSFEIFESTFDPIQKTIRVTLPPESFSKRRHADGNFEAIIVIGTTPTKPIPTAADPIVLGPPSAFDVQVASPEMSVSSTTGQCEGTTLGAPLQGTLTVNPGGAYNPP